MDYTISNRKSRFQKFMNNFEKLFTFKCDKKYVYKSINSIIKKKKISKGTEGVIFKARFIDEKETESLEPFVIKEINLKQIKHSKDITEEVLDVTPDDVYKLFYSNSAFDKPSLIEIIANTLTNQLVFQNVCQNFLLNYYWDYKKNRLSLYNEYANYGDFNSWAKQTHSNEIWFNAFFQITLGLIALKRYFNMLHTDFHMGNILVQKVKSGGFWTYKLNGFNYYVPNLGYIFLLSDFGFAWIPEKLYIPWHYKQRLSYVTENGLEFYDIATFINELKTIENIPIYFLSQIKKHFLKQEMIIYSKDYYKDRYKHYAKKKDSPSKNYFKTILKNYPENKSKSQTTLADKIYNMYYNGEFSETDELEIDEITYGYIIKKSKNNNLLDKFSLDKKFKKTKLPKTFRKLIVN